MPGKQGVYSDCFFSFLATLFNRMAIANRYFSLKQWYEETITVDLHRGFVCEFDSQDPDQMQVVGQWIVLQLSVKLPHRSEKLRRLSNAAAKYKCELKVIRYWLQCICCRMYNTTLCDTGSNIFTWQWTWKLCFCNYTFTDVNGSAFTKTESSTSSGKTNHMTKLYRTIGQRTFVGSKTVQLGLIIPCNWVGQ